MKRILIVEDDFYIRDIYSRIFSTSGYEVRVAVDGAEAIDMIKSGQVYDMILLDIMMPKMSGLEVLGALRSLVTPLKDTPVFMITSLGDENIINEAFKLGMDGYIIKSQVTPDQIVNEINTFLTGKEKEKTIA